MSNIKTFSERTYLFLASGTYLGYSPFAPGTVGTLWGIPVAIAITLIIPSSMGLYAAIALQAAIIVVLTVIAVIVASGAAKVLNAKDPGLIVCDEIVGFCVAAFMVELTLINIILVFILFRIFDILKPLPVSLIDKKVEGGLGIVLDDIAAGVYANIAAHIIIGYGLLNFIF